MKYESEILEMIHENATNNFNLGFITEAEMREFDEGCLTAEAFKEKYANEDVNHETVDIRYAELATA